MAPRAPRTSATSTRRTISSFENPSSDGSFSRKVAVSCSSIDFESGMPSSNAILDSEMGSGDGFPVPRRENDVEEETRTGFGWIDFQRGLNPVSQKIAS